MIKRDHFTTEDSAQNCLAGMGTGEAAPSPLLPDTIGFSFVSKFEGPCAWNETCIDEEHNACVRKQWAWTL